VLRVDVDARGSYRKHHAQQICDNRGLGLAFDLHRAGDPQEDAAAGLLLGGRQRAVGTDPLPGVRNRARSMP